MIDKNRAELIKKSKKIYFNSSIVFDDILNFLDDETLKKVYLEIKKEAWKIKIKYSDGATLYSKGIGNEEETILITEKWNVKSNIVSGIKKKGFPSKISAEKYVKDYMDKHR